MDDEGDEPQRQMPPIKFFLKEITSWIATTREPTPAKMETPEEEWKDAVKLADRQVGPLCSRHALCSGSAKCHRLTPQASEGSPAVPEHDTSLKAERTLELLEAASVERHRKRAAKLKQLQKQKEAELKRHHEQMRLSLKQHFKQQQQERGQQNAALKQLFKQQQQKQEKIKASLKQIHKRQEDFLEWRFEQQLQWQQHQEAALKQQFMDQDAALRQQRNQESAQIKAGKLDLLLGTLAESSAPLQDGNATSEDSLNQTNEQRLPGVNTREEVSGVFFPPIASPDFRAPPQRFYPEVPLAILQTLSPHVPPAASQLQYPEDQPILLQLLYSQVPPEASSMQYPDIPPGLPPPPLYPQVPPAASQLQYPDVPQEVLQMVYPQETPTATQLQYQEVPQMLYPQVPPAESQLQYPGAPSTVQQPLYPQEP